MLSYQRHLLSAGVVLLTLAAPAVKAQWAVIDVGAIGQLVQEVATMREQLTVAQNDLQQAQQAFQSMTGGRGMERLLAGTIRNYLPSDWNQLQAALQGAGTAYTALAGSVQSMMEANAVLTAQQLAALSPVEVQQIQAERAAAATLQTLASDALATTSNRFMAIQQLIDAIPAATDQKGILDLQARIGAEQGMLQNEQTKLQVLYQAAEGQERADEVRAREQALAGQGQFESRFQPTP